MGQSTDAILAFGFDLGEDLMEYAFFSDIEDPDEDFENAMGIAPYGEPGRPDHAVVEAMKLAYPVTVIHHCSSDYPMYFLAIPGTKVDASRGSTTEITADTMAVPEERIRAFVEWCEQNGVEMPDTGPAWHLFSNWG